MATDNIGFLGFGHMAQVLFAAVEKTKLLSQSKVTFTRKDPAKSKLTEQQFGIPAVPLEALVSQSDLIFLCVKPQQFAEVAQQLKQLPLDGKRVISVLAGTPLATLEEAFGKTVQVIRAMPNIASEVGEGMTILSYREACSADFQAYAKLFFESVGKVSVLPESLMDVASSMAGSGPGFVLRLIQAMAEVGKKYGMGEQDALTIAAQTFIGAGTLVEKGLVPSKLIVQIATPQGMTAAGFASMNQTQVDAHFMEAIEVAAARSKELRS